MKFKVLILVFLFLPIISFSQELITVKEKKISLINDSIFLDSLSVVSNSIEFYDNNGIKIELDFDFDFEKSAIIIKNKNNYSEVVIKYKTFPINFFESKSFLKKEDFLEADKSVTIKDYKKNYIEENNYYSFNSLESKGSIFRGLNFGNNQSAVLNSGLNLQLEGKITSNLNVLAAISDNNIPLQADGSSQQLQEFDKIFIKIFNDRISLTVADFEMATPSGFFMKYHKKAQGIEFAIKEKFKSNKKNKDNKNEILLNSSVSASIAKGKFRRQEINGSEGNQGPYKLTGENNETYLIVLSGTERVYIDGILQKRGYDNDYIIDYNLAEITFTANQQITKDKRIIVEFEYSDKNYTRYLLTSSNAVQLKKNKLWLNFYNESDNKNQSFEQNLRNSDKQYLSSIGDNLDNAYVPSYAYNENYDENQIRYKLIDSIANGTLYDSIFVYSTNKDSAFYTVSFAFVGANNGNYIKTGSVANGKVYKWIAPVNGVPQGDYIACKKIIAPKSYQMLNLGTEINFSDKTKLFSEIAYSHNDNNTFSKINNKDDNGFAVKTNFEQYFIKNEKNNFGTRLNYMFIFNNFQEIESFRATEFSRDWNIETNSSTRNHENNIAGEVFFNNKIINTLYQITVLDKKNEYNGFHNFLNFNLNIKDWAVISDISYLKTKNTINSSSFLRHNLSVSKKTKYLKFGIKENSENNQWNKNNNDSLTVNSYSFNQFEAFISTNDTLKYQFATNYKYRMDYLPIGEKLQKANDAHDFSFITAINPNSNHKLSGTITYRLLNVKDSSISQNENEKNLLGKLEYSFRLFKGLINSSIYYQIASGLERKLDYSYIEVNPGQGIYTWIDYNSNGVVELNEFETSQFSDQANYIRVISPSTEYIKTYSNQFNGVVNINPLSLLKNKKSPGLKFLSRFSNQFSYSAEQKNTSNNILEYANPFYRSSNNSKLVNLNSTLRNSFAFNRSDPKYGFDYIFLISDNKVLLVQGIDNIGNSSHSFLARYNFGEKIGLQENFILGKKYNDSEAFFEKNYRIYYLKSETQLNYQPNLYNRISLKYNHNNKNNKIGEEKLINHDLGIEYKLSSSKKGSLTLTFDYIYNKFNGNSNSSVAYEILEGLQDGSNFTISASFQRQIVNGLVIDISYNGRKSEKSKMIHIASFQIRAFF